jgi:ubiquinone/menaquinone biosynthesis C-methylase UbiE
MDSYADSINGQYGQHNLTEALLAALRQAGMDLNALTREDLASFEEIHVRGREATRDLARLAGVKEGQKVLDVGSGIGGPARTLAAEFGCEVVGIDMTENFAEAAERLTTLVKLDDRVTFRQGNALDMPFGDASFDVAWMQHMAMNIEDKDLLLREIYRVLRPGGRLAAHEVLEGTRSPAHFPVPWANDPSTLSFLVTPEEFRRQLRNAGLRQLAWAGDTEACIKWYYDLREARGQRESPLIGLDLLLGHDFPEKVRNVLRNLNENRIEVVQVVYERPG